MANSKSLARFTATPGEGGYRLHIEDEDGETIELTATREQLDVITDALDEVLEEDDSEDEVDVDEEEDERVMGEED